MWNVELSTEPDTGGLAPADDLVPAVYEQLCRLARSRLALEPAGHSHQTVDLVHEAYLRLSRWGCRWRGQGHFLAAAAEAMRRILVERARAKRQVKRGGRLARVEMSDAVACADPLVEEVILVDDLLAAFERLYPREGQLVKLHYFAGLNISEAGRALGISSSAAHRDWAFSRAWLIEAMRCDASPASCRQDRPMAAAAAV